MKWIAAKANVPLDQYDIVKLHVLTDFLSILERGEPVIGGQPAAWPYGPVVRDSYFQALKWADEPGDFSLIQKRGRSLILAPTAKLTESEKELLSPNAVEALDKAWGIHGDMKFSDSYSYFHDAGTVFGDVWKPAWERGHGTIIDWNDLIDSYDQKNETDHSHIKVLLSAPSDEELIDIAKSNPAPREYWSGRTG